MALIAALSLSTLFALPSHAGPRADHWSGFDLCAGQPFPSVAGVLVGFNLHDDARFSIGTGSFVKWMTYQLDAKVFFSPTEWSFYIGAGLDYMTGSRGRFLIYDYDFDRGFVPYAQLGVDFQSTMGVHVNFNLAGSAPNGEITILPGVGIGWYF